MKNNNLEWTNNKEFKNTPKTKKETYYLKTESPSGEKLICKCYNVLDETPKQKAGSMTRDEFEKLYAELSAKTEQRISDMLTTKFDQMEQKRLADKEELKQEINDFKNEILEIRKKDKEEVNRKIDSIVTTINTNNAKQNEILQDLVIRVAKLEVTVTQLKETVEEHGKRIDDLAARVSVLETDIEQLKESVKGLSLRMDRLETRMDALEARMDKLEERMSKLEDRVTSLEDRVTIIEDEIIELKKDKK